METYSGVSIVGIHKDLVKDVLLKKWIELGLDKYPASGQAVLSYMAITARLIFPIRL